MAEPDSTGRERWPLGGWSLDVSKTFHLVPPKEHRILVSIKWKRIKKAIFTQRVPAPLGKGQRRRDC